MGKQRSTLYVLSGRDHTRRLHQSGETRSESFADKSRQNTQKISHWFRRLYLVTGQSKTFSSGMPGIKIPAEVKTRLTFRRLNIRQIVSSTQFRKGTWLHITVKVFWTHLCTSTSGPVLLTRTTSSNFSSFFSSFSLDRGSAFRSMGLGRLGVVGQPFLCGGETDAQLLKKTCVILVSSISFDHSTVYWCVRKFQAPPQLFTFLILCISKVVSFTSNCDHPGLLHYDI